MNHPDDKVNDPHALDKRAARRAFSKASSTYDQVAVLQTTVRQQLLERLDLLKLQPAVVLDLGCGTGAACKALQQRYPDAQLIAMDAALGMLQYLPHQQNVLQRLFKRQPQRICADAFQLPLRDSCVDVVFSNLMLQWCEPPDAVLQEIRRVLKPEGVVLLTSFGPDTLKELRAAWAAVDQRPHVNRFIDMHDLGDAMLRAGLTEPVLDVDRFTLTYPDVLSLMRELKQIGAHNVSKGRASGLTGRHALQRMQQAYESFRRNDALPASYEVVAAQAWGNPAGPRSNKTSNGEVTIAIESIRRRI